MKLRTVETEIFLVGNSKEISSVLIISRIFVPEERENLRPSYNFQFYLHLLFCQKLGPAKKLITRYRSL